MAEKMLVATTTAWTNVDGIDYDVIRGKTRISADHPLAVRSELFEPVEDLGPTIEAATAAPGEKRGKKK